MFAMQEHQQALSCFFLEFWPSLERAPISEDQSLIDALILDPEVGPWPWCAEMLEGTRICHFRSNWGWQLIDTVLPLLPKLAKPGDLWIQNIGVWYNDPDSLRVDMNRFGQYYADHKQELPTMLWRQSSVQHFPLSPSGDFGGFWLPPHFPCRPIGGEMDSIVVDPGTGHLLTTRPDLEIVQKVTACSMPRSVPLLMFLPNCCLAVVWLLDSAFAVTLHRGRVKLPAKRMPKFLLH